MYRTVLIALCLVTTANAADVFSILPAGDLTGNFSSTSTWINGVVPGASDNAFVQSTGYDWTITYDVSSPAVLQSFYNSRSVVYFDRSVTMTGNMSQREGHFYDQGNDITVLGQLRNSAGPGNDYNGGTLVRGGGTYTLGSMQLGRATTFSFRSGDTINGSYTTQRLFNSWPDISIVQDPVLYGDDLEKGLSFDDPNASITLGYTSATDGSNIALYWDATLQGPIDWILRWRGNHETTLRNYYTTGGLLVVALPVGESFSPTENIFYNAADDYTYVGFADPDMDGDGVPNGSDTCPTDPLKTVGAGFCGCEYIDVDTDLDLNADACVHQTAFVSPLVVLLPGANIDANAVVAPRAQISGQVGAGAIVSRNAIIHGSVGIDTVIGRGVTVASGATVGEGAFISYAANIGTNSAIGDYSVLGPLVSVGSTCTVGNNVAIGRSTDIGDSVSIANDVVFGPDGLIGDTCVFEQSVKVRKGATIGDNVTIRQGAKVGRDSTLGAISGAATEIGTSALLRAAVTVPAGFCVDANDTIPRNTTVNTACP